MIIWAILFAVFCTALGFILGVEYNKKYGSR